MMSTHKQAIDDEKKVAAEEQIRSLRKEIDYNTRDYTIDFLIQQFRNDSFIYQMSTKDNIFGMRKIKIDLLNLYC